MALLGGMPTRFTWWQAAPSVAVLAAAVILGSTTATGAPPSFDCTKAVSIVEKAICANSILAALDQELATAFANAKASQSSQETELIDEQRRWLTQRTALCSALRPASENPKNEDVVRCIGEMYQKRILQLGSRISYSEDGIDGLRLIRSVGTTAPLRLDHQTSRIGTELVFIEYDATGGSKHVAAFDPVKRTVDFTGPLPHTINMAFMIDDAVVAIGQKTEIYRRGTAEKLGEIDVSIPPKLVAVHEDKILTFRQNEKSESGVDVFDRTTLQKISSATFERRLLRPSVTFWNGNVVAVRDGSVSLYAPNLQLIKTAPSQSGLMRGVNNCGIPTVRVFGDTLVYQLGCGRMVIFDLERFEFVAELEQFDSSLFVDFDVSGGFLFAIPTGEGAKPNNGGIYDLRSGKKVWVLPVTGSRIFGFYDRVVVVSEGFPPVPASQITIDPKVIGDSTAQLSAILNSYEGAKNKLAQSGSIEGALRELETSAVTALMNGGQRPAQQHAILSDYGAWLASGIDRQKDGIAVLSKLAASAPDDVSVSQRLAGAYLRDFLLTGSEESFQSARTLMEKHGRWTPDIESAFNIPSIQGKSVAIDYGSFSNHIYFFGDKMVIGRWKSHAPNVAVYDRNKLDLLWDVDMKPADAEQQDSIQGITLGADGKLVAWMNYRFEEKDRPDVALIDTITKEVELHALNLFAERVLATEDGIVVCSRVPMSECQVRDPRTLELVTKSINSSLMSLAEESGVDQSLLAQKVFTLPESINLDFPLSLNSRGVFTKEGGASNDSAAIAFRPYDDIGNPRSVVAVGARSLPEVWPVEGSDRVIVLDKLDFLEADLAKNSIDERFQFTDDFGYGIKVERWNDLFFIAKERDVFIYDLRVHAITGVLRKVTSAATSTPARTNPANPEKIVRMIVDGDRLIVLAFDGNLSTVIKLEDVERYSRSMSVPFDIANKMLIQ